MTLFPKTSGYRDSARDRLVASVVNWLLRRVATRAYCNFISTLLTYGRAEFERRIAENRKDATAQAQPECGKRFKSYEFNYVCAKKANHEGACDD